MADQGEARTQADGELAIRIAASIGAFTTQRVAEPCRDHPRLRDNGYNPFLSYAFLTSLEESGCAVPAPAGRASICGLKTATARCSAPSPAMLKSHSQGEYVFDHGWADAFERAGGRYYPKLQVSVPFTPVTGPRLLRRRGRSTRRGEALRSPRG